MIAQPSIEKSKRLLPHGITLHLAHTHCFAGAVKDRYDSDTFEQSMNIAWYAAIVRCSPAHT